MSGFDPGSNPRPRPARRRPGPKSRPQPAKIASPASPVSPAPTALVSQPSRWATQAAPNLRLASTARLRARPHIPVASGTCHPPPHRRSGHVGTLRTDVLEQVVRPASRPAASVGQRGGLTICRVVGTRVGGRDRGCARCAMVPDEGTARRAGPGQAARPAHARIAPAIGRTPTGATTHTNARAPLACREGRIRGAHPRAGPPDRVGLPAGVSEGVVVGVRHAVVVGVLSDLQDLNLLSYSMTVGSSMIHSVNPLCDGTCKPVRRAAHRNPRRGCRPRRRLRQRQARLASEALTGSVVSERLHGSSPRVAASLPQRPGSAGP